MFRTANLSDSRSIRNRYVSSASTTTDCQAREPVTVRIVVIRSDCVACIIRPRFIIRKFTIIDIFSISLGTTHIPTPRIIGVLLPAANQPEEILTPVPEPDKPIAPDGRVMRDCPGRIKKNSRNNKTLGFHCLTMHFDSQTMTAGILSLPSGQRVHRTSGGAAGIYFGGRNRKERQSAADGRGPEGPPHAILFILR